MKILLAEDEKALSDAEVAVLRHFGYEVDAAYDGLSAWQMAEREAYDCIVLDIMMPKMDGIEVLAKLRGSGSTVPIIMLTAKTEVDDRIAGLDAGADDYLTKPFAMGEFLARIRSMTRRANAFTPAVLSAGGVTLNVEEQELLGGERDPSRQQGDEAHEVFHDECRQSTHTGGDPALCVER